MENKSINWAILGTGVVANEMAKAIKNSGKEIYSVGNRTYSKAVDFANKYGIKKIYQKIDDMFDDENVDVIYITTPHNTHIDFIRKALANGKHILCEKSIVLNSNELNESITLAEANNLKLAEAMTIYHMPLYKKLKDFVLSGKLGPLQMIQINFGSYKEYDMTNRFFNKELAGGALLDIGVYAISLARYFMSKKPNNILSQVKYAPSGVDEQAGILLMNENSEMATISLTLHGKQPKRANIIYEKGYIEIMEYPRANKAKIYYTEENKFEEINTGNTSDALYYEMEDMEKAINNIEDVMNLQYTKDVIDIMTEIRKNWNMYYNSEL
ncbi:oxidoreductase [Tyzzerella sp. An114]|uniref:Gfo/Idh/MocA family protein n=1 Tax=Tyzzerella sp. An114 TaxID=1965545 RepID=UPI000B44B769|nr:Gfo/Idh/MocA family oxidoreductase [Tyzzerella sp. An114]OUQ55610.1 oxidoreductase [Tyzzerella sp. An114]